MGTPRSDQVRPVFSQDVTKDFHGSASTSESSSSSSTPSPFVPAFPYSVNLEFANSPLPGATPDDSELPSHLPSVQIDYLSEWEHEEDIWNSWKATTKQKSSMANGLRLENASWRQWNKQRNNLKTISPETLNWLKDSDVTWLYGPLHHVDLDLEPKAAKAEDRLGLDTQPSPIKLKSPKRPLKPLPQRASSTICKKPILKYRSLSDILTVPHFSHLRLDDESGLESPDDPSQSSYNESEQTLSPVSEDISDLGNLSASESTEDSEFNPDGRRKHIAFSNRVEQCIAVDSDDDRERYSTLSRPAATASKAARTKNRRSALQSSSSDEADSSSSSEPEEEEEPVLTFKSSRNSPTYHYGGYAALKRSNSNGSNTSHASSTTQSDGPLTIAKLAPTILKGSEILPSPSPAVIFSPQSQLKALPDLGNDSDTEGGASNQHIETVSVPNGYGASSHLESSADSSLYQPTEYVSASDLEAATLPRSPPKSGTATPSRSILKARNDTANGSASLFAQEEEGRGRPAKRTSSSSSLEARSASRHTSTSGGSSIERTRRISDSESDGESGKG